MKAPPSTVDIKVRQVTPLDAKRWLEGNEVNRGLRRKVVDAYRRDMESGRWEFTAEPIQISRTGRLLNGQHRLTALASAEQVEHVTLVVATGLPDEAQKMMDQGIARRLADVLSLHNGGHLKNVTLVSGITRWMHLAPEIDPSITHNTLRGKMTSAEAMATFDANPDIPTAAEVGVRMRVHLDGSPTAIGYTYLHLARLNPQMANEFFNGMVDLEWAWPDDPRKAVVKRLKALHRDPDVKTSLETAVMTISLLSRGWNMWRKEERVESLMVRGRQGVIPPVKLIP